MARHSAPTCTPQRPCCCQAWDAHPVGSACSGDAPPGTGVNGSCHLAAYKLHTHDHLFFSSSQPMREPTTAELSARLMPSESSAVVVAGRAGVAERRADVGRAGEVSAGRSAAAVGRPGGSEDRDELYELRLGVRVGGMNRKLRVRLRAALCLFDVWFFPTKVCLH